MSMSLSGILAAMVKICFSLAVAIVIALPSRGQTGSVLYSDLIRNQSASWETGRADPTYHSAVDLDSANDAICNNERLCYAIYTFDQPVILSSFADTLTFSYTLNIAYSEWPLYGRMGNGILTMRGNVNIHSGLGGRQNGMFNAAVTDNEPETCYHFNTVGAEHVTMLKPEITLAEVITNREPTTVSGLVAWSSEEEAFTVRFFINEKAVDDEIVLADKLEYTGIGINLTGPGGSNPTMSNIQVEYHFDSTPEPSSSVLLLWSLAPMLLRRRRR